MQSSLLDVQVLYEVDSSYDGKDLKKLARGDDGFDYAIKRLSDGPFIPISEWVGYQLWQDCGLLVPEFAALHYIDGQPPAFGSRIQLNATQLKKLPDKITIAGFFRPHLSVLSLTYPLDAFLPNKDRHGRNFLERPTLTDPNLLSIDYSQAWLCTGLPLGDLTSLNLSQTASWWKHFKHRMGVPSNWEALEKAVNLPDDWMMNVLNRAPSAWLKGVDLASIDAFWKSDRPARMQLAKDWITQQ
jgi:hypothetical protein